jgi:hypothetical protein
VLSFRGHRFGERLRGAVLEIDERLAAAQPYDAADYGGAIAELM